MVRATYRINIFVNFLIIVVIVVNAILKKNANTKQEHVSYISFLKYIVRRRSYFFVCQLN